MEIFRKLDHHADLVSRMASTVGADLDTALLRGRLTGQELRNAVMRCVACDGSADCPDWLADHTAGADRTPDYCRNAELFSALRG